MPFINQNSSNLNLMNMSFILECKNDLRIKKTHKDNLDQILAVENVPNS